MAHLSLTFLGGFGANLDAEPITAFGADKVRALLAYLAIESSRPHRRAELSAMFWPDLPETKAAHNLSQSLLRLRRALREQESSSRSSFLLVTTQDVQFNESGDWTLDVTRFRALLRMARQHHHRETSRCEVCFQWLLEAAELYHGDLLAGLFLADSIKFEEWQLVNQEELRQQVLQTFQWLANYYEQRGNVARALEFAQRRVALDPFSEEAHFHLIRFLAQNGEAITAIRLYENYAHNLEGDLGIKPSADMTAFYEQIRSGKAQEQNTVRSRIEESVWLSNQGERRQVTALVCRRASWQDDEEQLVDCEKSCTMIFNRFGGKRAPRQGDACLVYFGYPQAYEDAARRAVHSGLAVAAAFESDASVHIGIHTGFVTVGEKRGRRWQDRALIGRTPDLARECQQLAEPGNVVISENTRRLVSEYFTTKPLGTQVIRKSLQTMEVHQVQGEDTAQSRLEWLARTQRLTAFTGRAEQQKQLRTCYEEVLNGKGQLVLIKGEQGIGKSRLVWEFEKNDPILNGTRGGAKPALLSSRCLPQNQNTSLYPMIGLLEGLLGFEASDDSQLRLEKLKALLASYKMKRPSSIWLLSILLGIPTEEPTPETITKAQREQMRELFIAILKRRAAEQPITLIIEDLHWSDPSTVEWLGQSIDSLGSMQCLTVLTARPTFHPAWLSDPDLLPNLHVIALHPLSAEEAEDMVFDLAGRNTINKETRQHIVMHTDGNPLFVEELTKAILERPDIKAESASRVELPLTLIDSLVARLDHMGSVKEVAQWAAVIGREFSYPILKACTPFDEQQLQSGLERLIEAELVKPIHPAHHLKIPGDYAFKHALIQEAAYSSLLKKTRETYHQRIAETFETRYPQITETQPEVLAQHYSNADMPIKAVNFWLKAGERATAQGATLEALSFFERAINDIEPTDYASRWKALWGRENALCFRGERSAQKVDLDALFELAEILDDDFRKAQIQTRLARYATSQSDYRGQLAAAEAAIAAASRASALIVEVEALAYKVTALLRLGERAAVKQAVEKTLSRLQKISDDNIWSYAMAAVAVYYIEVGDLARAAKSLIQSLEAARRCSIRHLDLEAQYYGHLGFTYSQLGLYAQAREALEAGLELANLMGVGRYQAYHKLNLGFVYWRLGDLATAVKMEKDVVEEYSATGEAFGRAAGHAYLGYIYEGAGDWVLAIENLGEARAGFTEVGVDSDRIEAQAVEARVALAQGQRETAEKLTREVWNYLCTEGTEGLSSPSWVYVCIADVLDTVKIPDISLREVIETARSELMQRAEKISDADWRRSFLENVAENRTLVARWEKMNKPAGFQPPNEDASERGSFMSVASPSTITGAPEDTTTSAK